MDLALSDSDSSSFEMAHRLHKKSSNPTPERRKQKNTQQTKQQQNATSGARKATRTHVQE